VTLAWELLPGWRLSADTGPPCGSREQVGVPGSQDATAVPLPRVMAPLEATAGTPRVFSLGIRRLQAQRCHTAVE